jgi:hypothetical protein
MIEILGELYYIDFDEFDAVLLLDNKTDNLKTTKKVETLNSVNVITQTEITYDEEISHREINGVRFEILRNFISDLGDEPDEADIRLGKTSLEDMSIRFKLAFNTLLAYDILKKIE